MKHAPVQVTFEKARACADELKRVLERLKPVADLSALGVNLTPEGIIASCVAGAAPSKCAGRIHQLFEGGLPGLRAFLHLGTEAAEIQLAGFDPLVASPELDKPFDFTGLSPEQQSMVRHQALFVRPEAKGVWAGAHVEAMAGEMAVVEKLVSAKLGSSPDRGLLFWFDPGLDDDSINLNADLATKVGIVAPPRSSAPKQAFHAAYAELVQLARG